MHHAAPRIAPQGMKINRNKYIRKQRENGLGLVHSNSIGQYSVGSL